MNMVFQRKNYDHEKIHIQLSVQPLMNISILMPSLADVSLGF